MLRGFLYELGLGIQFSWRKWVWLGFGAKYPTSQPTWCGGKSWTLPFAMGGSLEWEKRCFGGMVGIKITSTTVPCALDWELNWLMGTGYGWDLE